MLIILKFELVNLLSISLSKVCAEHGKTEQIQIRLLLQEQPYKGLYRLPHI